MVSLGHEFHADLLLEVGHRPRAPASRETLSAPCYSALKRPEKGHFLSDASFEAVGGYCVERRAYRRCDLSEELTVEIKCKAELRQTCTVTINLLELLGMVVTAWLILELVGTGSRSKGIPFGCAATTSRRCRESAVAAGQGINAPVYS